MPCITIAWIGGCAANAAGMNSNSTRQSANAKISARLYEAVKMTTISSSAATMTSGAAGQAEDQRGAGDAGEFGDERGDVRDEHRSERDPRPAEAVMLANQARVTFAGDRAQAHRHLLNDEERHDQQELQKNQLEAVLRARLSPRS